MKLFILLLILPFSLQAHSLFYQVPTPLKKAVSLISELPETHELLAKLQREGKIHLEYQQKSRQDFEALWLDEARLIALNPKRCHRLADQIRCLLFELHNAQGTEAFKQLDHLAEQGKLDKTHYVEAVERLEHRHVLETAQLLKLGVSRGLFPQEASWTIMENFEDHYDMQQLTGHSTHVAEVYDQIAPRPSRSPFQGKIVALEPLTEREKELLAHYLWNKAATRHGTPQEQEQAHLFCQQERARLQANTPLTRERLLFHTIYGAKKSL